MRNKNSAKIKTYSFCMPMYTEHSVQQKCLQFVMPDKEDFCIKINAVWRWSDCLLIGGTTSTSCEFQIYIDNIVYIPIVFDSSEHTIREKTFALKVHLPKEHSCADLILCVTSREPHFSRAFPLTVDPLEKWALNAEYLVPVLGKIAGDQKPFSSEWHFTRQLLPESSLACPSAVGALDFILHTAWTGQAIISGWYAASPGTQVWIEHDNGHTWPLHTAWRYYRKDVQESIGNKYVSNCSNAFITSIDNVPPFGKIYIKAIASSVFPRNKHILASAVVENCGYDVRKLAEKAFLPTIALREFAQPAAQIFEPVLSACLAAQTNAWQSLPVEIHQLGQAVVQPDVSLIIPLYGRHDYVDYQLAAFREDAWLCEHGQIIYVLDDPDIISEFAIRAELLHRIYTVPFCWMWGHANRGFSGANNLGATQAHANTLIFMNSDVFPQKDGWAQKLHTILHNSPSNGAVGPRLLRVDGVLQHAGMRFRYMSELGVWVNEHPYAGCSPSLDPYQTTSKVSAVTGACLAVRREYFNAVGAWDSGYLIGDFEDSDLCLKLRNKGLDIIYAPGVSLTHLERQSYPLLGSEAFRQRVTIYNAVRHQKCWGEVFTSTGGVV